MNNSKIDTLFLERNEILNKKRIEYEYLMNTDTNIREIVKNLKDMVKDGNIKLNDNDKDELNGIFNDEVKVLEQDLLQMREKLKIEHRYINLFTRLLLT